MQEGGNFTAQLGMSKVHSAPYDYIPGAPGHFCPDCRSYKCGSWRGGNCNNQFFNMKKRTPRGDKMAFLKTSKAAAKRMGMIDFAYPNSKD